MRQTGLSFLAIGLLLISLTACPGVPNSDYTSEDIDVEGTDIPESTPEPDAFYVYRDSGYSWNHFVPSGFMGDVNAVALDEASSDDVFEGTSCQRWKYNTEQGSEGWAGVIFQHPENNWNGDEPDSGYDLTGKRLLVFSVRGEIGGEVVTFGFGGLEGDYPDSCPQQQKKVTLTADWQTYSVVIEHLDLNTIHNGFMWTIDTAENDPGEIVFYLDDIRYVDDHTSESYNYKLPGICFSPFTDGTDPTQGGTATVSLVEEHMALIASHTQWVRTYGMDGGLAEAGSIAHEKGLKIAMGAWIERDADANAQELATLVERALAGEVEVAVVGNEVLHRRDMEVADLVELIEQFRSQVPNIPVTTAEVYSHWMEYPELVAACDYVLIQSYPFWDGIAVDQAVGALHAQYYQVVDKAMGKPVWVSETGWPSDGSMVGDAVPSASNAALYFLNVAAWSQALDIPVFYFEAFDEPFKSLTEPNSVGNHWGIFTRYLTLKDRMEYVFRGYTTFDYWIRELPCGEGDPSIEFTHVPPYGSYEDLRGQVCHVWPADYAVAVYIYVSGWWTKPYFDRPLTLIQADGSFVTDITTGGVDQRATAIAAYLVPIDYDPPTVGGGALPATIKEDALAELIVYR